MILFSNIYIISIWNIIIPAKVMLKDILEKDRIRELREKPMHGQLFCSLEKPFVDKEASCAWLRNARLKGETENSINIIYVRYHQHKVLKKQIDGNCRECGKAQETLSHVTAGCAMLASIEYLHTHIGGLLCSLGCEVPNKCYKHTPRSVVNINENAMLRDFAIITDRKILANRPDILIHDRKSNSCMLIDVSVPDDKNIALKEADKISDYKDLEI